MRIRIQKEFKLPSRTKQAFKDEVDINRIMIKYQKTGVLPVTTKEAQYGDFTDVPDLETAMNKINAAYDTFMQQPSTIRKRFNNDPAELLAFIQDENNRNEAENLGLLKPKQEATAPAVKTEPTGESGAEK